MTTYESALYHSNPGEARLRLWRKEKEPEIELKFKEMQRDINAKLGQGVRELLGQTPYDHRALMNLYQEAEEEQAELQMLLREGFEAEAAQLKTSFMHAALNHPDELWFQDPTEEVRERIKSDPQTKSSESYCSPVLVETLLWEGMEGLPNTHRRKLELDFPDRVEALLDFHCIAFHADVNVLKELYDDDVLSRKADKVEVLARHQAKMNRLMVSFAKDMNERWAEQTERMRARGSPAESPARREAPDVTRNRPSPPNNPVAEGRRRAHIADCPPTVLGSAAEQKSKTAQSLPRRGILKKASAGPSARVPRNHGAFDETVAVDSLTFDVDDEVDIALPAGSFFSSKIMTEGDAEEELKSNGPYREPEIVLSPLHRQYASTSRSYEIFRPHPTSDMTERTPRAANNVAKLTQRFEDRMEQGKGKGKAKAAN